jgi:hypothetical protein
VSTGLNGEIGPVRCKSVGSVGEMVAGSMIQLTVDLSGLNKSAGSIEIGWFNIQFGCFIGFGLIQSGHLGLKN